MTTGPREPLGPIVAGLEAAVRRQGLGTSLRHRAFYDASQAGANDWAVVVGDVHTSDAGPSISESEVTGAIRSAAARSFLPSMVLDEFGDFLSHLTPGQEGGCRYAAVVARIELDICGAWVTVASTGEPRLIVIREAGWVDVRGHSSTSVARPGAAPVDDRVGLGPGDMVALCSEAITRSQNENGECFGEHVLADVLIDCAGQPADAVAASILASAKEFGGSRLGDDGTIVVLRVPETVRDEGAQWVSDVTGVPEEQLRLPGYPLPDGRPDVWNQPSSLPREALIRLAPEPPSIPALRRLLRLLLRSWRMDVVSGGDIELLLTEVTTNAFAHTASPVTVIVRCTGDTLRVEVGDARRERPRRRRRSLDNLIGLRLSLVEALASDWGVSTTPTGSRMWFEVPATQPSLGASTNRRPPPKSG